MKPKIKFDHKAEGKFEAIGIKKDEFKIQMFNTFLEVSKDKDDTQKSSKLSEAIHNELDYNCILLLATDGFLAFLDKSGLAKVNDGE